MTNVEVERTGNENNLALLRRFSKRVQSSGVLTRVRGVRYRTRPNTKLSKKKSALRRISRKNEFERLYKLGKVSARRDR